MTRTCRILRDSVFAFHSEGPGSNPGWIYIRFLRVCDNSSPSWAPFVIDSSELRYPDRGSNCRLFALKANKWHGVRLQLRRPRFESGLGIYKIFKESATRACSSLYALGSTVQTTCCLISKESDTQNGKHRSVKRPVALNGCNIIILAQLIR